MKTRDNGVSLTTHMLGNELEKYRTTHKTTYEAIAKEMSLSRQAILDIRKFAIKKPDYVNTIRIISFLGISDKNRDLMIKTDYPFMYKHNQETLRKNHSNDVDKPYLYRVMDSAINYASFESASCSGISRRRLVRIWGTHAENIIDQLIDEKVLREHDGRLRTIGSEHYRSTDRGIIKIKHKYALEMIDTRNTGETSDLLTTATGGVEKEDYKRLRKKALEYHQDLVTDLRSCIKGDNPIFFNIAFGKFTDTFYEDELSLD